MQEISISIISTNFTLVAPLCFPPIHCYHMMNLPLRHHSMNYFGQSDRNMSNNFLSFIGFLRVNWNCMFTLLMLCFSQALKFFNYSMLITTAMRTLIRDLVLATKRQPIFVLSRKKTF